MDEKSNVPPPQYSYPNYPGPNYANYPGPNTVPFQYVNPSPTIIQNPLTSVIFSSGSPDQIILYAKAVSRWTWRFDDQEPPNYKNPIDFREGLGLCNGLLEKIAHRKWLFHGYTFVALLASLGLLIWSCITTFSRPKYSTYNKTYYYSNDLGFGLTFAVFFSIFVVRFLVAYSLPTNEIRSLLISKGWILYHFDFSRSLPQIVINPNLSSAVFPGQTTVIIR
jgi:hypothetical protein